MTPGALLIITMLIQGQPQIEVRPMKNVQVCELSRKELVTHEVNERNADAGKGKCVALSAHQWADEKIDPRVGDI